MEKISRILPSNGRTRAVDVSNSQPVRPGAPRWGRAEGKVTRAPIEVEDRVSLSTAERAIAAQPTNYKNNVEAARAKIAEDMSKKFFGSSAKAEIRGGDRTSTEEVVANIEDVEEIRNPAVSNLSFEAPTGDVG